MIYNLLEYLVTELPALDFVANGWRPSSPVDSIMVSVTGGEVKHWYDRTDWSVQILSRAKVVTVAKYQIDTVYTKLKNKWETILPEVTVDAVIYPAVTAWQISPIQAPGYLGATDESLEMFSFNLMITTT